MPRSIVLLTESSNASRDRLAPCATSPFQVLPCTTPRVPSSCAGSAGSVAAHDNVAVSAVDPLGDPAATPDSLGTPLSIFLFLLTFAAFLLRFLFTLLICPVFFKQPGLPKPIRSFTPPRKPLPVYCRQFGSVIVGHAILTRAKRRSPPVILTPLLPRLRLVLLLLRLK